MAIVKISHEARRDLIAIHDYIEVELENPDAAQNLMREMYEKIGGLGEMPERGAPLIVPFFAATSYRFLICGSYRIFYGCFSGAVEIYRILNARQNHIAALFGK